jgi:phosphohistidine swiveling domain-containing protein
LVQQLAPYVSTFRHLQFVDDHQPITLSCTSWSDGEQHVRKVTITDAEELATELVRTLLLQLSATAVSRRLDAGQAIFGALPLVLVSLHHSSHHVSVVTHQQDATVLSLSVDGLSLGRWDRHSALQLNAHEPGVFALQVAHRKNRKAARLVPAETQQAAVSLAAQALSVLEAGDWTVHISLTNELRVNWIDQVVDHQDIVPPAAGVVAHGFTVHPGTAVGITRFVKTTKQRRELNPGAVVVVPACALDDISWLAGAAAVITEESIPPASAVRSALRRLGAPVLYVPLARFQMVPGQLVTVDGTRGVVYAGRQGSEVVTRHSAKVQPQATATKLLTILKDPLTADAAALGGSDGIGLLRGEFLLDSVGGKAHEIVKRDQVQEYGEVLHGVLAPLMRALYPNPVFYQLHDIQLDERHRTTGTHGAQQLLATPELLPTELAVLADLHATGAYHMRLLIPGVRSLEEIDALTACVRHCWPEHSELPELWVRVVSPAVAMRAQTLLGRSIDGVLFDVPALAELLSGYDRHHPRVSHMVRHHDAALRELVFHAVDSLHRGGMPVGILSEQESIDDTVLAAAIAAGAGVVVTPPAEIHDTRHLIMQAEQQLLVEHVLSV